ncbi:hypothetical protein [Marinicella marina]|uniref:hypothetical protein n=1 Tax=Marinicella marina TaxID=2996016 RepID=UPI0024BC9E78|nr:hypothetical protein [Marinicella marina]MDJ1138814.1 hypothetical protein [Marinicella marina]
MTDTTSKKLTIEINKQISFHRFWKRITSVSYYFLVAGGVTLAAVATILSGKSNITYTPWIAAASGLFATVERLFLLREKWTHHRLMESKLKSTLIKLETKIVTDKEAAILLADTVESHAMYLPVVEDNKATVPSELDKVKDDSTKVNGSNNSNNNSEE